MRGGRVSSDRQGSVTSIEPTERIKQTIDSVSAPEGRLRQPVPPGAFDRPAIGLVIGEGSADAVAGTVLRANRAGHHVLVTVGEEPDVEALDFALDLGASVINANFGADDPVQRLYTAAREYGFPGLLYQDSFERSIDLEASEAALSESSSYAMAAEVTSVVDAAAGTLIAIPAYNEACSIQDVVTEARQYADGVLVVDDGSEDETAKLAREAGAAVVEHGRNRGYGGSLKTIFEEARRSQVAHLVVLDADGQHDPSDVPRLVERQRESEAEIVIGSRFAEGAKTDAPLYRRAGLFVVNALTNLSLGVVRSRSRVRDTQSGFRAYSSDAVRSLSEDGGIGDHMGASTDILQHAHREGYDIEEVGTTVEYQVENGSNQNPVSHGVTLVMNLLRTIEQQRPVTVLGIPGFVSAFLGLGFGYWTFSTYIQSGVFPLGLAVTSSFFGLAGIFACFTAIILHALNQQY